MLLNTVAGSMLGVESAEPRINGSAEAAGALAGGAPAPPAAAPGGRGHGRGCHWHPGMGLVRDRTKPELSPRHHSAVRTKVSPGLCRGFRPGPGCPQSGIPLERRRRSTTPRRPRRKRAVSREAPSSFQLLTPMRTVERGFQAEEDGVRRTCGSYEPKVWAGEAAKVGKDCGEVAAVHAEPCGQGCKVLIAGRGGDPAAGAGIVGTAHGECGKGAVGLLAVNRTAHD